MQEISSSAPARVGVKDKVVEDILYSKKLYNSLRRRVLLTDHQHFSLLVPFCVLRDGDVVGEKSDIWNGLGFGKGKMFRKRSTHKLKLTSSTLSSSR